MSSIRSSFNLAIAFILLLPALALPVQPGQVTDSGSSRRYQESFDSFSVGAPPSDTWYTIATAGTGIQQVTDSGCPGSGRCWLVSDTSAPYAAQLLNLGNGVDLCNNAQSVQFDLSVPDLSTGAVWEYRVSGAAPTAGALPNSAIAVRFTGIIGSLNEVRFVVRGSSGAESGGSTVVTSIAGGTALHALISGGSCPASGTASFTFTVGSIAPTVRQAALGDTIALQLNRLGMVNTLGAAGGNALLDNYDWQGAPLPAIAVSGVIPANGYQGTEVRIGGSGFQAGAEVRFDYQEATITQLALNELRVTAPYHVAGPATITITNPDGSSASAAWFYNTPPPVANCPGLAGAGPGEEGNTFQFDTYKDTPLGGIPDRCWYEFTVADVLDLQTTTDSWADSSNIRQGDGTTFKGFQTDDVTSLRITPKTTGGAYAAANWNIAKTYSPGFCDQQPTSTITAVSSLQPYRISLYSSSDPTELQTPNSGSFQLDVNPGTSSHAMRITNNDGTFTNVPFTLPVSAGSWYFWALQPRCADETRLTGTSNPLDENPPSYAMTLTVWGPDGSFLLPSANSVVGDVNKRPTFKIDTVGLHCNALCYQDAFSVFHGLSWNRAVQFIDCQDSMNGDIIGFDYSGGADFGIYKIRKTADCPTFTNPSLQVHTISSALNRLGTWESDSNPETCTQDYGVLAYVSVVGICYNNDYPSATPEDEQHCLYIRTRFFDSPSLQSEQDDFLCEDHHGAFSTELAAMDKYGIDYSAYNEGAGPCSIRYTPLGFAFAEVGTGIMGIYQETQMGDCAVSIDDVDSVVYVRAAPHGTTVTQVCAWIYGGSQTIGDTEYTNQYIAGIVPGFGVKLYRMTIDRSSASNPNPTADDQVGLAEIPMGNPAFNEARGLDCQADKIYLLTADTFYVIRAIPRPTATKPNVGDIIYSTPVNTGQHHLVAVTDDSKVAVIGTSNLAIYTILDETNIGLIGSVGFPSDDTLTSLSTLRVDRQANNLYLTTKSAIWSMVIKGVTNGGKFIQDPNPTQGGASGYQDTDLDLISDAFDPCPNNPDVDRDGVGPSPAGNPNAAVDGNDASFVSDAGCVDGGGKTYDGTVLRDCSIPGRCDPNDGFEQPGSVVGGRQGNGYFPGLNLQAGATAMEMDLDAYEAMVGALWFLFLTIAMAMMLAFTKKTAVMMMGGLAGGIVAIVLDFTWNLWPLWLAVLMFLVLVGGFVGIRRVS